MDNHYVNPKLARLYDLDSGWNIERDFYMSLAGDSPKSILDLGCGTGLICEALAGKGHDVTGADPAPAMLAIAKTKPNSSRVNWVQTKAQNFKTDKKFDLIIMTGNAFQVFLQDEDLKSVFQVMSAHLKDDGLIVFETRNPDLDWKSRWNYEEILETPEGTVIESRRHLRSNGPSMKFELLYKFPDETLNSQSELRFWRPEEIKLHASKAGLFIERLMGDWNCEDFNPKYSKEMV